MRSLDPGGATRSGPAQLSKGMLQVAKALAFLHEDAKIVHGNLNPESVFVNAKARHSSAQRCSGCGPPGLLIRSGCRRWRNRGPASARQGDWKVAGFAFSTICKYEADKQTTFNYPDYDPSYPAYAQPLLDYLGMRQRSGSWGTLFFFSFSQAPQRTTARASAEASVVPERPAPEYIIEKRCDVGSDMWSFGCLIYALHNDGKSPMQARDTLAGFQESLKVIDSANFSALPPALGGTAPAQPSSAPA